MPGTNLKFTVIQKNLLISKGLQNYKSPSNMSSTTTHDHYAASFPSSLWSSGLPISAYTKDLVIIAKRKTTQEDKHKQRG